MAGRLAQSLRDEELQRSRGVRRQIHAGSLLREPGTLRGAIKKYLCLKKENTDSFLFISFLQVVDQLNDIIVYSNTLTDKQKAFVGEKLGVRRRKTKQSNVS